MKEYIERDYLVKEAEATLMFRKQFYMDKKYIQDAADTVEWLKYYAPAADVVEVVHGRWVDEGGEIVCSECGVRIPEMYSNADSIMQSECKFCHVCGAKMDKEK